MSDLQAGWPTVAARILADGHDVARLAGGNWFASREGPSLPPLGPME